MKHLTLLIGILFVSSSLSHAQANCNETPPDGLSPLAAYSLFHSNYKNGDYEFALKYGKWIICSKMEKLEGNPQYKLETQYDRLVKIYTEIGRSKDNDEERTAYIDTALTLLNEQLELFGNTPQNEFDIIFKRGRFYQTNYNYIEDGLQKAYQDYEKLFDLNPERATTMGDGYYLRQALSNLVSKGEKERAQALIDAAKPYAEGETLSFIEEQQQELLGSPEEQVAYFEPVVKENPQDLDAWKALAEAYDDLGERAKLKQARVKINELEQSFDSALDLAELAQSNANYAEADKYFKEALSRAENDDLKVEIYLDLADANISMERLAQAKNYVQEAINLEPNNGNAYIKMATVYGSAVTQCTEDRKLQAEDKVVYWLVIDYLNKAKSVDPSVANTVNNQLSTYQDVTPNSEDKFFTLDLEDGQTVRIDGSLMDCYSFINETTTVR
ncbi:tetratricopeptide repeat protein [Gracilimonas tropica]|uniref:tetratricopeptide repeat protein n=1 Tax=Gracilimonas tropica TaxID=454600 RepID=UPI0008FBCF35|nr:tetratricopeptide repeat protein [Gracilimonas tropica]